MGILIGEEELAAVRLVGQTPNQDHRYGNEMQLQTDIVLPFLHLSVMCCQWV